MNPLVFAILLAFLNSFSEKFSLQEIDNFFNQHITALALGDPVKIVDNHSGYIDVTSETGKGARFDIYIPVA